MVNRIQKSALTHYCRGFALLAFFSISVTNSYAQWDGSGISTSTTSSNVGIGYPMVHDARLKLLTVSDPLSLRPASSSLDVIPGVVIQREFYTRPNTGLRPASILEIWKQNYAGLFAPSGPNELKFVVDGEGNVGVNKEPTTTFDVGGDANIDGTLYARGNASPTTSADALIVSGNITFTRPLDQQYRNVRARTNEGSLVILANTSGEDGPSIALNGRSNTTFSTPGAVAFSSYGSGSSLGYAFNNYDPAASSWTTSMSISCDGKVAIGPSGMTTPGSYKLYVKDGILTERIKVALSSDPGNWADFVFADDYKLRSLDAVESFIKENKHLPEIPSTAEVHKEGLDLAQMDAKLLQKIEELTLYVIQQQKEIDKLKKGSRK